MFTLPEGLMASTTAYIGEVFSGYYLIIALAVGIPLAFYVIRKVMSLFPGR